MITLVYPAEKKREMPLFAATPSLTLYWQFAKLRPLATIGKVIDWLIPSKTNEKKKSRASQIFVGRKNSTEFFVETYREQQVSTKVLQ